MRKTSLVLVSASVALAYALVVGLPTASEDSDSVACGEPDAKKKKKKGDDEKS